MKKNTKNKIISIFFFFLFFIMLKYANLTKTYALHGLTIWYQHMLPALLPFMILSGILIDLNLEALITKPFSYILKPLFRISDAGIYTLIMGYLCGFPMGAKVAATEYQKGMLSKAEMQYLMAFCNNFGPAYYLSFVCGNLYDTSYLYKGLICLYLIPLLYGLILRYTTYKQYAFARQCLHKNKKQSTMYIVPGSLKSSNTSTKAQYINIKQLIKVINKNIINSLSQIGILGGYMILCNALMTPICITLKALNTINLFSSFIWMGTKPIAHSIFEISGGLLCLKDLHLSTNKVFCITHILLMFNGLSCHMQTFYMLEDCPISRKKYMLHKLILCSILCIIFMFRNIIRF